MEKVSAASKARIRHERRLEELLNLTKENNEILRGDRNRRRLKTAIVMLLIIGSIGYSYYLFQKHRVKIIEFQETVEELQIQIQEAKELSKRVGETAGAVKNLFGDDEE